MKKLLCMAMVVTASVAMAKTSVVSNNENLMSYSYNQVYNVTFTEKARDNNANIDTLKIQGIIITHGTADADFYYWTVAPKGVDTETILNWYINAPKFDKNGNAIKQAKEVTAPKAHATKMSLEMVGRVFSNGKIDSAWAKFTSDTVNIGVGTGTNNSLGGNVLTFKDDVKGCMYGTWRATYDAAATATYRGESKVKDPMNYNRPAWQKGSYYSISGLIGLKGAHYYTGNNSGEGQIWKFIFP